MDEEMIEAKYLDIFMRYKWWNMYFSYQYDLSWNL